MKINGRRWEPSFKSKSIRSSLWIMLGWWPSNVMLQSSWKSKIGEIKTKDYWFRAFLLAVTDWISTGKYIYKLKPKDWSLRNIYIQGEKKCQERIIRSSPKDWRTRNAILTSNFVDFLNFDPLYEFISVVTTKCTTNWMIQNNSLFSHRSEGQNSEIKVLAGPCSLRRL